MRSKESHIRCARWNSKTIGRYYDWFLENLPVPARPGGKSSLLV
jgi:hypothetical protein